MHSQWIPVELVALSSKTSGDVVEFAEYLKHFTRIYFELKQLTVHNKTYMWCEKLMPITFCITLFAIRITWGAAHKCTRLHWDLRWMAPNGEGSSHPQWTLSCEGVYTVTKHISFPRLLIIRLQCACNMSKVMWPIIVLPSQITKHISQKLAGAGTCGISNRHKLLSSYLRLDLLRARTGPWVPLSSEPVSYEFGHPSQDAAAPVPSLYCLCVSHILLQASTMGIDSAHKCW